MFYYVAWERCSGARRSVMAFFSGAAWSGATTERLPQELGGKNISWERMLPGYGLSTPVVHSNKVFITCEQRPRTGST
jgi:hypothetical protein